MYWNDEEGLWVIWCFAEHKHFTAYDYVNLVLCEKYQKYKSPLDFLKQNMSKDILYSQLELYKKEQENLIETSENAKVEHISKVAFENERTEDYIEALYLG